MHYLLWGAPPAPATARAVAGDAGSRLGQPVPGVSTQMVDAVVWMLGVRPEARPQDIATVRAALNGESAIPAGTGARLLQTSAGGVPAPLARVADSMLSLTAGKWFTAVSRAVRRR